MRKVIYIQVLGNWFVTVEILKNAFKNTFGTMYVSSLQTSDFKDYLIPLLTQNQTNEVSDDLVSWLISFWKWNQLRHAKYKKWR